MTHSVAGKTSGDSWYDSCSSNLPNGFIMSSLDGDAEEEQQMSGAQMKRDASISNNANFTALILLCVLHIGMVVKQYIHWMAVQRF